MYAQFFLGIAMLVMASGHWRGKASLIRSGIREVLDGETLRSYQRSLALQYTCLGILFIVMGLVEKQAVLRGPRFVALYIVLALVPILWAIRNNKKHLGRYW
jgi:hypothetical protein